jgi:uncharacterized peroxidase-related enzyme
MSRLPLIDPTTATGSTRDLLDTVQTRFGATINMTRAMANSPALLKGYLELSGALASGALPVATRELIALAVSETNACSYCLSAHTYLAQNVARLDDDTIEAGRNADSADPEIAAALTLAVAVTESRGDISDADLATARAAGLSDKQIAEVIGHVALTVLTNYFNKAVDVDVDFPVVTVHTHAA